MTDLKITCDEQANAAYIYLVDPVQAGTPGAAANMYACDPIAVNGMINLDFDKEGRVIGVEVLDARSKLPQYLLDTAERLDV
ncbi:DUF2283 domain-containing protein [Actinomadura rudentiformis]|uniref:DUF2283 domain-containing protein n=1 Tax=Actinomadura rudentiformis TaxID=359158 RepID=A0A6H9YL86_9ACTN|nr:DUF2283 domain-containing protein [Actinomadura rudentiformis]KAB2347978.1 DUF2283 domain-containing protein [Actinomadura rudentiformis]